MALRLAPIVVALAVAACGSTPTSPAPVPRYTLSEGSYTLDLFPGSPTICFSIGSSAGTSIAIPVTVRREGSMWAARPQSGSLTMLLADASDGYVGTLGGSFALGGSTVTVGFPDGPATVAAPTFGIAYLIGTIQGDVRYSSGAAQSSCSVNAWSLIPR